MDKIQEAIDICEKLEVQPYPEDIFLPVFKEDLDNIHIMLKDKFNMPLDRLTGHIGRLLRKPVIEDARQLKQILISLQLSTVTDEEIEAMAANHSTVSYAQAPEQPEEDAQYVQAVSYYSYIAGAKAIRDKLSSVSKQDQLISELQERAEIAEDELDKIKQASTVTGKQVITDEELEAMAVELKDKSPVDGTSYVNLNPVQSSTVTDENKLWKDAFNILLSKGDVYSYDYEATISQLKSEGYEIRRIT